MNFSLGGPVLVLSLCLLLQRPALSYRLPTRISTLLRGFGENSNHDDGIVATLTPGEALSFLSDHVDVLLRENNLLHHRREAAAHVATTAVAWDGDPEDRVMCEPPPPCWL